MWLQARAWQICWLACLPMGWLATAGLLAFFLLASRGADAQLTLNSSVTFATANKVS